MRVRVSGISQTIKLINSLETNTNSRVNSSCKNEIKKVVDEASNIARNKYTVSDYAGVKDITVSQPKWEGNRISFKAEGGSVLFVEFGTGINYEDKTYGSTYPRTDNSPIFIRGTYGLGKGSQPSWVFVSPEDITSIGTQYLATNRKGLNVYRTKGNESSKAMLNAYNHILDSFNKR